MIRMLKSGLRKYIKGSRDHEIIILVYIAYIKTDQLHFRNIAIMYKIWLHFPFLSICEKKLQIFFSNSIQFTNLGSW
jgi:hypothetical protein